MCRRPDPNGDSPPPAYRPTYTTRPGRSASPNVSRCRCGRGTSSLRYGSVPQLTHPSRPAAFAPCRFDSPPVPPEIRSARRRIPCSGGDSYALAHRHVTSSSPSACCHWVRGRSEVIHMLLSRIRPTGRAGHAFAAHGRDATDLIPSTQRHSLRHTSKRERRIRGGRLSVCPRRCTCGKNARARRGPGLHVFRPAGDPARVSRSGWMWRGHRLPAHLSRQRCSRK
jgi:hypothetical protein